MKRTGKPYEGKPHVRFDEKMLEIGYGWDIVTLSEETERNREYKHQPVATTPVFYSTIGRETIKFLTSTSVEHGMMEPLELKIVQNNEDSIISLAHEKAPLGNGIVHSFILSKKTGFAIWTKSKSTFLMVENPDAQAYYFECF